VLKVENLSAGYKELRILFDITARFEEGRITTIAGPNGSGKSTLLKSIFGLTTIHGGQTMFNGKDITFTAPYKRTRMGIAYLPQVGKVFTNLRVSENLKMAGYILEDEEFNKRQEVALDTFPDLRNKLSQKAANLSGGERQFLGIATALIRKANILMLDEPSAMLSPKFSSIIFKKILELKERFNLTILLVEQNIKSALDISDNAYMLKSGKIDFEGTAQNLLKHDEFEKFCIGI